jgi:hypothetical protein
MNVNVYSSPFIVLLITYSPIVCGHSAMECPPSMQIKRDLSIWEKIPRYREILDKNSNRDNES